MPADQELPGSLTTGSHFRRLPGLLQKFRDALAALLQRSFSGGKPMLYKIYTILVCLLLLASSGCTESDAVQLTESPVAPVSPLAKTPAAAPDACEFISTAEIEKLQGDKIIEAKSSSPNADNFIVSQCYYMAEDFSKSVVLSVYRADPASPGAKRPKEFWKDKFDSIGKAKGKSSAKKKEKEFAPPLLIAKLGDQAYWLDNKIGGALYVLKGDEFLRVSVGGTPDEKARISKAKTLAEAALKHL